MLRLNGMLLKHTLKHRPLPSYLERADAAAQFGAVHAYRHAPKPASQLIRLVIHWLLAPGIVFGPRR